MAKSKPRARSTKRSAPLPPHRDPRFAEVPRGLTIPAAVFDKLEAAGCYFDATAADRSVLFFDTYLVHTKGEWAGESLRLELWQEYHTRNIFGWKRPDGTRVFRTVYFEIPRKNGKSTWIAGIGLLLLSADREEGAEIYSAANDRDQAAIVFDQAKSMVVKSPELTARCDVLRRAISVPALGASYKVLSADVQNKHGFNGHGILFDELHAQPDRELWDVLTTSTGSRRQPLTVAITTAGFDQESICWELHEYARKVAQGIFEDAEFYPAIYAAPQEADWKDPAVWGQANPNLGVSVKLEYLEAACARAKNDPAFENTFRRLHLNQWTQQKSRWLPMVAWDACGGEPVNAEALHGKECYGGLDLASSIDIAALALIFAQRYETDRGPRTRFSVLPFFWIPEDNIKERVDRDHVPYDLWVKQGLIRTTPGNVIDYDFIVGDIAELRKLYPIVELAYDRWGAAKISTDLQELGLKLVPFGQGFSSMSSPSKDLLRLVLSNQFAHGGNRVLRWMADNAIVKQDPAGNIKPDKSKSSNKIDGIVATIMALDRATRKEGGGPSVYETRDLQTV